MVFNLICVNLIGVVFDISDVNLSDISETLIGLFYSNREAHRKCYDFSDPTVCDNLPGCCFDELGPTCQPGDDCQAVRSHSSSICVSFGVNRHRFVFSFWTYADFM